MKCKNVCIFEEEDGKSRQYARVVNYSRLTDYKRCNGDEVQAPFRKKSPTIYSLIIQSFSAHKRDLLLNQAGWSFQ